MAWLSTVVWVIMNGIVLLIGVLMIAIILIQDSKDAGLGGAFGGGGGGGQLMGARMQKDLAKLTTIFAVIFAVCVMIMGIWSHAERRSTIAETGGSGSGATFDAPEDAPQDEAPEDAGTAGTAGTNPLDSINVTPGALESDQATTGPDSPAAEGSDSETAVPQPVDPEGTGTETETETETGTESQPEEPEAPKTGMLVPPGVDEELVPAETAGESAEEQDS